MKSITGLMIIFLATIQGIVHAQNTTTKDSIKCVSASVAEFKNLIDLATDVVLIDVRSHPEFRTGRIPGAINVPAGKRFKAKIKSLGKKKIILLYCTSGVRSCRAAIEFSELGFKQVYSLKGGIKAWKTEGFPVVRRQSADRTISGRSTATD
jgi:rhodanese-related sulfurtransferase